MHISTTIHAPTRIVCKILEDRPSSSSMAIKQATKISHGDVPYIVIDSEQCEKVPISAQTYKSDYVW